MAQFDKKDGIITFIRRGKMKGETTEKREANRSEKGGGEEGIGSRLKLNVSSRQIIIFLIEFMAVSVVFLCIWYYIGEFYQCVIFFFAKNILIAMGYTQLQISAVRLSHAYLVNFNLVPLFALAIATPKMSPKSRIEMLAVGIPLIFLLHIFDLVAHFPMYFYGSEIAKLVVYSIGVGNVAMPFVIWFVYFVKKFY